jgi:hypothetical protein
MSEARWLDREAAARHIRVKEAALAGLVRDGLIPAPSYRLGPKSPRWDRLALDAAFEGGVASTDPSIAVQALAEAIIKESRPRRSQGTR